MHVGAFGGADDPSPASGTSEAKPVLDLINELLKSSGSRCQLPMDSHSSGSMDQRLHCWSCGRQAMETHFQKMEMTRTSSVDGASPPGLNALCTEGQVARTSLGARWDAQTRISSLAHVFLRGVCLFLVLWVNTTEPKVVKHT